MEYIFDGIEENFARLEDQDGNIILVFLDKLPKNLKIGDVIVKKDELYFYDEKKTEELKKEVNDLMDDLFS